MKKIIIALIIISTTVSIILWKQKKTKYPKEYRVSKPITKEYLFGKKFVKPAIMGSNILEFTDNGKAIFTIEDKRSFGYDGTYLLNSIKGKQYIKINNIEKFGKTDDWQDALRDYHKNYVIIEIISPTKLKVEHSGTILELIENKGT